MPVKKPMICIDCRMRIDATIPQAHAHGWNLWVGGARCKTCVEKEQIGLPTGDPAARICECGHTERWHRERCLGGMHRPELRCECLGFRDSEVTP